MAPWWLVAATCLSFYVKAQLYHDAKATAISSRSFSALVEFEPISGENASLDQPAYNISYRDGASSNEDAWVQAQYNGDGYAFGGDEVQRIVASGDTSSFATGSFRLRLSGLVNVAGDYGGTGGLREPVAETSALRIDASNDDVRHALLALDGVPPIAGVSRTDTTDATNVRTVSWDVTFGTNNQQQLSLLTVSAVDAGSTGTSPTGSSAAPPTVTVSRERRSGASAVTCNAVDDDTAGLPSAVDGIVSGAVRCRVAVFGLLPDRRYQFRITPDFLPASITREVATSFTREELRRLTSIYTNFVPIKGSQAPSTDVMSVPVGSIDVLNVDDSSATLQLALAGLPLSMDGSSPSILRGASVEAQVLYDSVDGSGSTISGWTSARTSRPQVHPLSSGAGTQSSAVIVFNVTGLVPLSFVQLRLRVVLPAGSSSSHVGATAWSNAVSLTTLPAPPPPPALHAFTRSGIGPSSVWVGWDDVTLQPRGLVLLGYGLQFRRLPVASIRSSASAANGGYSPGVEEGWVTVESGTNRATLLAMVDRPISRDLPLQLTCLNDNSEKSESQPITQRALDLVSLFGSTRLTELHRVLSVPAMWPVPNVSTLDDNLSPLAPGCTRYSYQLRVDGLQPQTLYQFRTRTLAQRLSTSDGDVGAGIDLRRVVLGPWSAPSHRLRTRGPPRSSSPSSAVDEPLLQAQRHAELSPPSLLMVRPPAIPKLTSTSASLSWPRVFWPPEPPTGTASDQQQAQQSAMYRRGLQLAWGRQSVGYALELAAPSDDSFEQVWVGTGTSAVLRGLSPESTYRVRLIALHENGDRSQSSDAVAFTTPVREVARWDRVPLRPSLPAISAAAASTVSGWPSPAEQSTPPPLAGASLSVIGRHAYLFGGLGAGYDCSKASLSANCSAFDGMRSEVWRVDLRTMSWDLLPVTSQQQPLPRAQHAAAVIGGDLYIWSGAKSALADLITSASAGSTTNATGTTNSSCSSSAYHSDMWRLDVGASAAHTRVSTHGGSNISMTVSAQMAPPPSVASSLPASALREEVAETFPVTVSEGPLATGTTSVSSSTPHTVASGACVEGVEVTVQLAHPCPQDLLITLVGPGPQPYRQPSSSSAGAAAADVSSQAAYVRGDDPLGLLNATSSSTNAAAAGPGAQEVVLLRPRRGSRASWLYSQGIPQAAGIGSAGCVAVAGVSLSSSSSNKSTVTVEFTDGGPFRLADCAYGAYVDMWKGCNSAGSTDEDGSRAVPALQLFHGLPAAGLWVLKVTDSAKNNVSGALVSWSLRLLSQPCVPSYTWTQVANITGSSQVLINTSIATNANATDVAATGLPPSRAAATAVVVGGSSLLVWGGIGERWAAGMVADDPSLNSSAQLSGQQQIDLRQQANQDLWRFDVSTSTWTQLFAPPYASSAVRGSYSIASSAFTAGPPGLTYAPSPAGLVAIGAGDDAALPRTCDRYSTPADRWRYTAPQPGGLPSYAVRADEFYACEDPAGSYTVAWDGNAAQWRRLHPTFSQSDGGASLDPWSDGARVPSPREDAAVAVVPAHSAVQAAASESARVLLFGGRAQSTSGPTLLRDLWSLSLLLEDEDGSPSPASTVAADACDLGAQSLLSFALDACLRGNASSMLAQRAPCTWDSAAQLAACALQ